MLFLPINKKQFAVAFTIGMISYIGDINLQNQTDNVAAAICDNVTHALIGIFTWIGTFINKTTNPDVYFILEILLCGVCSSVIDVDHFIMAKSLKLKDATSLKGRPFFHCTTAVMSVVFVLLLFSYCLRINWLFKFGWILAAAFLSHHIRDSKRRGFWIWPYGHTMATPFFVYMAAQMLLPFLLSALVSRLPPKIPVNDQIKFMEPV